MATTTTQADRRVLIGSDLFIAIGLLLQRGAADNPEAVASLQRFEADVLPQGKRRAKGQPGQDPTP